MERIQNLHPKQQGRLRSGRLNIFVDAAGNVLAVLLMFDLMFNVIHIWWWTTLVTTRVEYNPNFSITHEGGFGERSRVLAIVRACVLAKLAGTENDSSALIALRQHPGLPRCRGRFHS